MNKLTAVLALSLLPTLAFAEDKKAEPAKAPAAEKKAAAADKKAPAKEELPPEVKKTVDAMTGNWTFDGTVTGMGPEPIKVKETFACKKAAGGRAVLCHGSAKIPGMGTMEEEGLVTYDVNGKDVRFIGVNSMGEMHDHHCSWKDDKTLACEPLAITDEGQAATVDFTTTWTDAKNLAMTETTTRKDGTKVTYEGKGKR